MKPLLKEHLRDARNDFERRNRMREYLQSRILLFLQDRGAFTNWAFVGGTALRFLFRLPRYSEDLDFSLRTAGEDARFPELMESVARDFNAETYRVYVKTKTRTTVASALVKFSGLLYEMGISPHKDEALAVKVEIDTHPPAGAETTTSIVRRFDMIHILHYDRASLLAGKLHAVLSRKYTKGRDLFDLAWYLSDVEWPAPNIVLLDNALQQTGWPGPAVTAAHWRKIVAEKLEGVDWNQARLDVSPFVERERDADFVSRDAILSMLTKRF